MSSTLLSISITQDLKGLEREWDALLSQSRSNQFFLGWKWQSLWWDCCIYGQLKVILVRDADELIGVAPLFEADGCWRLAGGEEVADYLDWFAKPGCEADVAEAICDAIRKQGGSRIVLRNLCPESLINTQIGEREQYAGWNVRREVEDVSPRLELAASWDEYVSSLNKKDRHELRRKIRRLESAGDLRWYAVSPSDYQPADLDDFVRLHRASALDKAGFMTDQMVGFFGRLMETFIPSGEALLYFLELDGVRIASTICFDFQLEMLLYNSGYDPEYSRLAAGLLLKAFCIEDAIRRGKRGFDFLQGDEPYKYDLGGVDVPIYQISMEEPAGPEGRS